MPYRSCLFFLSAFALLLSGCQDHKDPSIENFGQIDSSLIAADTTMQVNMDRSYEFQKTLVKNDTEVYDFLAYDKPKGSSSPEWESKFIVIRRTTSASDTVIKDIRSGIVRSLWLSDLDENGKPEIMFYEYPKKNAKASQPFEFYAYQMEGRGKAHKIEIEVKHNALHYKGQDSFFVDASYLIRKTPYYENQKDSLASGYLWQSYKLVNGKLIFDKEKKELQ